LIFFRPSSIFWRFVWSILVTLSLRRSRNLWILGIFERRREGGHDEKSAVRIPPARKCIDGRIAFEDSLNDFRPLSYPDLPWP
jgi:hypothetical protein